MARAERPRNRRPRYYPLLLDLSDRPVVVIGGGPIATRKAAELLAAGATLTVISPTVSPKIARWAREGRLRLRRRRYRRGDLKGASLVIAATSMPDEHVKIADEASTLPTWLNVADEPELCDFIAPAVITRGELMIAVSTGGRNPALARWLRQTLQGLIGEEYGRLTRVLGEVRTAMRKAGRSYAVRSAQVDRLMASPLLRQLREGDTAGATRTVRRLTGLPTLTMPRLARAPQKRRTRKPA